MKIKNIKISQIFCVALLIIAILLLVISPQIAITSFAEGLQIWATKVLPSLLPFFILTKLLSYTSFASSIGNKLSPFTSKIYGVSGDSGYIYIMSVISGYPVGAKLTADLYTLGKISHGQAIAITSFTSTSGPLFIIGSIAVGLFGSQKLGIIIIISHIIGALLNGLLYRCQSNTIIQKANVTPPINFLQESMTSSILGILQVGGFIALFYMAINLMININIFAPIINIAEFIGLNKNIVTAVICGFLEVTTGCVYLSKCAISANIIPYILTFLISFGGLSIHAQSYCYLKTFNMSYCLFLLQKTTHALLSTMVCVIIYLIF